MTNLPAPVNPVVAARARARAIAALLGPTVTISHRTFVVRPSGTALALACVPGLCEIYIHIALDDTVYADGIGTDWDDRSAAKALVANVLDVLA
jgi:hypothetical protein